MTQRTIREAIKDSLNPIDEMNGALPICFPHMLESFTVLLMMYAQQNILRLKKSEDMEKVAGCFLGFGIRQAELDINLMQFVRWWLDQPADLLTGDEGLWYSFRPILDCWNEFHKNNEED